MQVAWVVKMSRGPGSSSTNVMFVHGPLIDIYKWSMVCDSGSKPVCCLGKRGPQEGPVSKQSAQTDHAGDESADSSETPFERMCVLILRGRGQALWSV